MQRDPATLEILGSTASDDNKSVLLGNLYMTSTGNKAGAVGRAAECQTVSTRLLPTCQRCALLAAFF